MKAAISDFMDGDILVEITVSLEARIVNVWGRNRQKHTERTLSEKALTQNMLLIRLLCFTKEVLKMEI